MVSIRRCHYGRRDRGNDRAFIGYVLDEQEHIDNLEIDKRLGK